MTNPTRPITNRETGDGRAQPGDVLGVDREGERTHLGEMREDEDKRREEAEEAARDKADGPSTR